MQISPLAKGTWRGLQARHSGTTELDHFMGRKKDSLFGNQTSALGREQWLAGKALSALWGQEVAEGEMWARTA